MSEVLRNMEGRAVAVENRRVRFVASREIIDRHGTIIRVAGIDTSNFDKNPIFLWGHDGYGGLVGPDPESVIGRVVGYDRTDTDFIIEVEFTPEGVNPRADMVFKLVQDGFLRAVSIGFYPKKQHTELVDGNEVLIYDESELVEVSLVPIPSNPEALAIMRSVARHLPDAVIRGVVPRDVSRETAPMGASWTKPTLADFTDKAWEELSAPEKNRIARHYAWAPGLPPDRFSGLKLPHHRPSDGAVVWRGVRAAMAALLGARGGVNIPDEDRRRVYNHLASHYRQFDKEPPEFKAYDEDELRAILEAEEDERDAAPSKDADLAAIREILSELKRTLKEV